MLPILESQDFINCAESVSRPERVHSTVWDSTTRSAVTRAPEDREEGKEVGSDTWTKHIDTTHTTPKPHTCRHNRIGAIRRSPHSHSTTIARWACSAALPSLLTLPPPPFLFVSAQLFENYGQPSSTYMLYHGFVLQNNSHDCLDLTVSITPDDRGFQNASWLHSHMEQHLLRRYDSTFLGSIFHVLVFLLISFEHNRPPTRPSPLCVPAAPSLCA